MEDTDGVTESRAFSFFTLDMTWRNRGNKGGRKPNRSIEKKGGVRENKVVPQSIPPNRLPTSPVPHSKQTCWNRRCAIFVFVVGPA